MSQLPADCLNEIFECLEEDKVTLRSCLLVNRLWCEVSVRILWRRIRNYNTLIACLPNESKEILYQNKIITSASASSTPPIFNYASFCKVLSINKVNDEIRSCFFKNQRQSDSQQHLNIVIREILKLLMNQISSLKKIKLRTPFLEPLLYVPNFPSFPGAKDCLKNLTELCCYSSICPEFFYQLSKICHNIQSLSINFEEVISSGLADLISVQQNLKCLYIMKESLCKDLTAGIITSLKNLPDTLIKIELHGEDSIVPLSFITKQANLQEMTLSFEYLGYFEGFQELNHATFSHLQVLKFRYESPSIELLIKFLANNGRNLKEFFVNYNANDLLNLAIAMFCPNLRKLFTGFSDNALETLKIIFYSCQYLESIQIWCCDDYLNEKELFDILVTHSPKNFYELKLCYSFESKSELLPEELESFFTSWAERIPQKSLSLVVMCNESTTFVGIDENMKVIEKYIKLGIVKEFKVIDYYLQAGY